MKKKMQTQSSTSSHLLINEVDADSKGADKKEFIELFDGGKGQQSLDGYSLVLFNGKDHKSYAVFDLSGYKTNEKGYFVVGNKSVDGVDYVIADGSLQNGADAVALYQLGADEFPNKSAIRVDHLLDALVYDTNDADDEGLLKLMLDGEAQINEAAKGKPEINSNQRCPNGAGGGRESRHYVQAPATPGQANACQIGDACGAAATLISAIQGSGTESPLLGQRKTVEAIVVGDFQDRDNGLSGFFLQQDQQHYDDDASSSEGIFIHDKTNKVDVNVGDRVRVSGSVAEFYGLTELKAKSVKVCATDKIPPPVEIRLPFTRQDALERYEGMLVRLPQSLTVSDNHMLGRYGEFVVSSGGRLYTATQIRPPGNQARAQLAANNLNRLIIDDGSARKYPIPIPYPAPGLSATHTLRVGDTVSDIEGVVAFTAGEYRIHPTRKLTFQVSNPRQIAPNLTAKGDLRVASFNVFNYFNGDGNGEGFPAARGASSFAEFQRQRAKVISAINSMQADIIGLMEIENDGYGTNSAIQDLLNGLNAVAPSGVSYRFINPGVAQIGSDAITTAIIYRSNSVVPLGPVAILNASVDSRFNDKKNRPSLAQTFTKVTGKGKLTVVVNHFKSKSSKCNDIGDPDLGDGQGNCNQTRRAAAKALVNWLRKDPTHSGDSDFLIIGDLNAYAMEDPVSEIKSANYRNLLDQFVGAKAYSYVFNAQSGNMDHALASPSLAAQVSAVSEWHINADEPSVLDYNQEDKSEQQLNSLYRDDAFRASDHDPIVIELQLSR